jgi:hypothetical protein
MGGYEITKRKKDAFIKFKLIGSLTIKDPINKSEKSNKIEDALKSDFPIYAIADGAGGCGIFCGEWAAFLLDKLPINGFETNEDLLKWFDTISEEFNNEMSLVIKPSQHLIEEKFSRDGSFSTLSAIWLKGNTFKYLSIGDSGIFGFKKQENGTYILTFLMPFCTYNSIDANPNLLNWLYPLKLGNIHHDQIECEDLDVIILASDSISRFMLSSLLYINKEFHKCILDGCISTSFVESIIIDGTNNYSSVSELLDTIRTLTSIKPDEQYSFLFKLIEAGKLQSDDLSIIMLEK